MADEGIFATTEEVQRKSGANASSVSNVESHINQYMTEAESEINVITGFNWSDAFSGLDVDKKGILKRAATSLAATDVINFDPDAIGRSTAELQIDKLRDDYLRCISILRQVVKRDFVNDA